ncbi:unnamed protein product [Cochlearia groenlandica]
MSLYSHVEPLNGYPSDNNNNNNSSDTTTKYDDLVRNSDLFWSKLRALLGDESNSLRFPAVGGSTLDLHRLFIEVTSRGGIDRVIEDRKWKEVKDVFNFPATMTNSSFVLRKYYLKYLYQLEQVYYNAKLDSSVQTTGINTNILVFCNDEPKVGSLVNGYIDGKFESGYLVTITIGSEELKGVVYHVPEAPNQPQQTVETTPAMAPPKRRYKKRAKLTNVDSQKPKSHRSGYNFFFAEQHSNFRFECQRQDIAKKIGHMWSNLTESEKQVYQDKGVKDVERYRTEMSEYKSLQLT